MDDEVCNAELAPAWCDENSYSHLCDHDPEHDGTHQCGCGHQWTEPDDG